MFRRGLSLTLHLRTVEDVRKRRGVRRRGADFFKLKREIRPRLPRNRQPNKDPLSVC